jgi:excisionase family DNA binding protein
MTRQSAPAGYLMPNEAAAILQVSMKTVNRWAREGKLPYHRTLGGHRRYKEDDIRKLLVDSTFSPEHRT